MADGPTLATLGIKIENGDVVKATTSLDNMTVAGTKTEAATDRLSRRMALLQIEAAKMNAEFGQVSREMGLAEVEALKMNDSLLQGAKAAGGHGLQLGRLNMEMGTFIGRATGANTAATRLGAMIGGNVVGYGQMIAVLGGISALLWIWDKTADGLANTKKAQDEANRSLKEWYDTQEQGVGGKLAADLEVAEKSLDAMQKHLADIKALVPANTSTVGAEDVLGASLMAHNADQTQGDVDKQAARVKAALDHIAELQASANASALAARIAFNKDDSAARAQGLAALAIDQAAYAALLLLPFSEATNAKIVEKIHQIDELKKALFPKDDEVARFAKNLEVLGMEVDKQIAMNAVTTDGSVAKAALNLEYDRHIDLVKNTIGHTADEAAQLDKLTNKKYDDLAATAKRTEAEKEWQNAIDRTVRAAKDEFDARDAAKQQQDADTKTLVDHAGVVIAAITAQGKAYVDNAQKVNEAAQKYSDQMNALWLHGIDEMLTHGLTSWTAFFDSVLRLASQAAEKMKKDDALQPLMGTIAVAAGGAIAGYQVGANGGGNRGSSALFGAASGAAAGASAGSAIPGIGTAIGAVVGSIAGFVGGIIGAGHAADLAASAMANLQQALAHNIDALKAQISGDALGASIDAVKAQFDALRQNAEEAYAGGANEAQRNVVLAQLNTLEAQRIQQLKDDAAQVLQYATEDYKVRTLRAQGLTDEADATAFAEAQERELAAARKAGADVTALIEAQQAEATQRQADIDKAAADKALQLARGQEDAQLRLMAAQNDPAYEAAARAAQERREIEDLVASKASDATIKLTEQAQAAEDLAKATADAAAAMQKQIDAQRALEDLAVRDLRAKGETAAADDLAFKEQQQREYENAVAAGQSKDYLDALQKTLQDEATQRALNQLIDSTTGPSSSYGAGASSAAAAAVQASVTERTALTMVDLDRARNSTLDKIELNTRNGSGTGGGGPTTIFQLNFRIAGNLSPSERTALAREILDDVQELSGNLYHSEQRFAGSVHG